jgi:type II secretory pathway pseudopilin PulG
MKSLIRLKSSHAVRLAASMLAVTAVVAVVAAIAARPADAGAPPVNVQQAAGTSAAAIQSAVDAYRADLGTLNPNVAGSFGSGRREINWDGVPDAFSAPNLSRLTSST